VREEYGFMIDVVHLQDLVDHILAEENQHWVSPTYLCRYRNGKPRIMEPHKCDEFGWFGLDSTRRKNLPWPPARVWTALKSIFPSNEWYR
jgi:hypothetical protein